jgi:alkanesulfonate monooxygenase SsuD/methylene tetrahydromethanopterin reductase-like flavin-dependent oxidoreductase (luciferase family)
MSARIGFGLSHEQFAAPRFLEFGVAAEEAGFDQVWTSDHFHPWQDNQGHSGQAWITLPALAQRTRRIPFGSGFTCPSFRYRRFVPIGLKELLDEPDPRVIQRVAEERLPLQGVYRGWLVSDDPRDHVAGIQKQFEAGVTDVFIHSGQADQERVIDFYAR